MSDFPWGWLLVFLVLIGGCFVVLVKISMADAADWSKFADEHKCKVVGKIAATTGGGFSSKETYVTTFEPERTQWLCDDGITYTR